MDDLSRSLPLVNLFYCTCPRWKINILETVDISIAGGMSVDYVLHMAHAFNHYPGTSSERGRGALKQMGVSVLAGMFTTFIACIPLYLCDMVWFSGFGCFVTMVIVTAFFVSMSGLMAFLEVFGPDEPQGEVKNCLKKS